MINIEVLYIKFSLAEYNVTPNPKERDELKKRFNGTSLFFNSEDGKFIISQPKTKSSIRKIPIPDILIDDLIKLKNESMQNYGFSEKWFLFGCIESIQPDRIRKRKNRNAAAAGVKQIRVHDFRHSCASLLINNGANVTLVAKYLGHAKIDETLNTYSHMFESKLDDLVNTINTLNNDYKESLGDI